MKWLSVGLFVAGTALAWGLYAPIVQIASEKLGSDLRALLLVGLTYFGVGVLVPAAFIVTNSDPTIRVADDGASAASFNASGVKWGLAAGLTGVGGAMCMIFALTKAGPGAAVYVAPVVFAAVPVVNTIAAMTWFSRTSAKPEWPFYVGVAMAGAGALLILLYRPADNTVAEAPDTASTVESPLD